MRNRIGGFTLIELLIVVAIIAILAAIAVPNFLEAQTRAKVSRARSDMRTVATALESYAVDWNRYPLHRGNTGSFMSGPGDLTDGHGNDRSFSYRTIPTVLSTPVAYITSVSITDPFKTGRSELAGLGASGGLPFDSGDPTDAALCYQNIWEYVETPGSGFPEDDLLDYGNWRLFSLGPIGRYPNNSMDGNSFGNPNFGWIYDPTNGTVSKGAIIRTQTDTVGARLDNPD